MAKVKNLDGTGFLKDGNGNFIDSKMFDESPLDEIANIPKEEIDETIDRLFPDLKVNPEEETP